MATSIAVEKVFCLGLNLQTLTYSCRARQPRSSGRRKPANTPHGVLY